MLANTVSTSTLGTNCGSGSVDTRCTATVTVSGLTIAKSADVATTTPGSVVRYTVLVTNSGQTPFVGATFTDNLAGVLDDAAYNADATATGRQRQLRRPESHLDRQPGRRRHRHHQLLGHRRQSRSRQPLADQHDHLGLGRQQLSERQSGRRLQRDRHRAGAGPVDQQHRRRRRPPCPARPSRTRSPSPTPVRRRTPERVSPSPWPRALDDATYDGNAAASAGSVAYAAGTGILTWTGDLAVGAVATVTASVTVRNPDPGNRTLTTVASSSAAGSTCPTGSGNAACTSAVPVLIPALTIAKTADVTTTTPGSVVRYTVLVTNSGQTSLHRGDDQRCPGRRARRRHLQQRRGGHRRERPRSAARR